MLGGVPPGDWDGADIPADAFDVVFADEPPVAGVAALAV
jgi:hypothetical protein